MLVLMLITDVAFARSCIPSGHTKLLVALILAHVGVHEQQLSLLGLTMLDALGLRRWPSGHGNVLPFSPEFAQVRAAAGSCSQ